MKRSILILALSLAPLSFAQDAPADNQAPQQGRPDRAQMHQRALEKFDKDGDGKLNEEERAEAKAFHQQMQKEGRPQGQKGQQGPQRPQRPEGAQQAPAPEGEAEAPQGPRGPKGKKAQGPNRAKALEKFDKDGDGQLNEEERAEAKAFRQQMKKEGRPQGQKGQQGPQRPEGAQQAPAPEGEAEAPQGPRGPKGKKAQGPNRAEVLEKFDKDGDGKLNKEERAEAKAFRQQMKKEGRPQGPEAAPQGE